MYINFLLGLKHFFLFNNWEGNQHKKREEIVKLNAKRLMLNKIIAKG